MIVKLIQIAMIQKLREYSKEYSIIPTQNNLNQFNKVMKSSENEQEIKEDGNVSKSIIEKIKYFISFYIKYIVFIILTLICVLIISVFIYTVSYTHLTLPTIGG